MASPTLKTALRSHPSRAPDFLVTTRLSKADLVYSALKGVIISGELPPGVPIDKNEICARLQVSRLPVTTAINHLAYEGLVLIEPQRGSFVAPIKLDDVVQWMQARRALEVEVVRECARHRTPEMLQVLERNLLYQQAAIGGSDFAAFLQMDIAFHDLLTSSVGLRRIGEILDSFRPHLDRVRRLLLPQAGRMESTLSEHRAIVEALASRNGRKAEQAMQNHLQSVLEHLIAFERDHPDFFGR
jgi:GntR family transcriptional regulator, rspAB operon transcriptional repressor